MKNKSKFNGTIKNKKQTKGIDNEIAELEKNARRKANQKKNKLTKRCKQNN